MLNIRDKLEKIDKDHFKLLSDIGNIGLKENLKVYLVGGMVRDILLGVENLDIDITVENDSLKLADGLVKNFSNCKLNAKHDRFHTAKLIFNVNNKIIPVDLASTREETYKHPAALPDVKVSELKKDLIRRDFTINALAVSLLPHNFGEVADLFGGYDDLRNKKIKILHDKSFIDDPTRMIRAIRFSTKLKYEIEETTKILLQDAIESKRFDNLIETIRGDRVKIEIKYLFNLPDISEAIKIFFESGVYRLISTSLRDETTDLITHSSLNKQWLIVIAIILKNIDENKRLSILQNLQLTSEEINIIDKGIKAYNEFLTKDPKDSISAYKILRGLSIESVLIVKLAVSGPSAFSELIDRYLEQTSKIKLEITGEDLISMGVAQGKKIGEILETVLEKKIVNPTMSKKDEINEVKKII